MIRGVRTIKVRDVQKLPARRLLEALGQLTAKRSSRMMSFTKSSGLVVNVATVVVREN